jgi:hypothetical protein
MAHADSERNLFSAPTAATGATAWSWVLLAIGAGVLAAVQVGKAHIALPSIRSSFSLSLVDASWILSALSFVGLFVATPVGSLAAKICTVLFPQQKPGPGNQWPARTGKQPGYRARTATDQQHGRARRLGMGTGADLVRGCHGHTARADRQSRRPLRFGQPDNRGARHLLRVAIFHRAIIESRLMPRRKT